MLRPWLTRALTPGGGSVHVGARGLSRPQRTAAGCLGQPARVAGCAGTGAVDRSDLPPQPARSNTRDRHNWRCRRRRTPAEIRCRAPPLVGEPHIGRDRDDRGRLSSSCLMWRWRWRPFPAGNRRSRRRPDLRRRPGPGDLADVALGDGGARRRHRRRRSHAGLTDAARATDRGQLGHRLAGRRLPGRGQGVRQWPPAGAWRRASALACRRADHTVTLVSNALELPLVAARAHRRRPIGPRRSQAAGATDDLIDRRRAAPRSPLLHERWRWSSPLIVFAGFAPTFYLRAFYHPEPLPSVFQCARARVQRVGRAVRRPDSAGVGSPHRHPPTARRRRRRAGAVDAGGGVSGGRHRRATGLLDPRAAAAAGVFRRAGVRPPGLRDAGRGQRSTCGERLRRTSG